MVGKMNIGILIQNENVDVIHDEQSSSDVFEYYIKIIGRYVSFMFGSSVI